MTGPRGAGQTTSSAVVAMMAVGNASNISLSVTAKETTRVGPTGAVSIAHVC